MWQGWGREMGGCAVLVHGGGQLASEGQNMGYELYHLVFGLKLGL